jgi:hypothetical protein
MTEQPTPTEPTKPPNPATAPATPTPKQQMAAAGGMPISPQILAQIMAAQMRGATALPGGIVMHQASMNLWQGQFPPPEAIERFEAVLPGSFDRIIKMTEDRLAAEIKSSQGGLAAQVADVRRGHYLGAVVTGGAMVAAVICALIQQPVVAVAFLAVPVMSVANSLIETWRTPKQTVVTPLSPVANTPPTAAKSDDLDKELDRDAT